jgi:hypothetical protein
MPLPETIPHVAVTVAFAGERHIVRLPAPKN